jgi:hypothetical protein
VAIINTDVAGAVWTLLVAAMNTPNQEIPETMVSAGEA